MVLNDGKASFLKEACVETFAEAKSAQNNGADVIELCSNLHLDGLTPSLELTQKCLSELDIPIKVMIRSRGGNFVYSSEDLAIMQEQILEFKNIGINQFVFGALSSENTIDIEALERISESVQDSTITFHKAFDEIADFTIAIEVLKDLKNFTHLLTSGGESTALAGVNNLKNFIRQSNNQLTVIPAGKVTAENVISLHNQLQATHYHGRRIV